MSIESSKKLFEMMVPQQLFLVSSLPLEYLLREEYSWKLLDNI